MIIKYWSLITVLKRQPVELNFTKQVADDNGFDSLDLKLKIVKKKIYFDVYSKSMNSFTFTLP